MLRVSGYEFDLEPVEDLWLKEKNNQQVTVKKTRLTVRCSLTNNLTNNFQVYHWVF